MRILFSRYFYQNTEPLKRYGKCIDDFMPTWLPRQITMPLFLAQMRHWMRGNSYAQGIGRHDK